MTPTGAIVDASARRRGHRAATVWRPGDFTRLTVRNPAGSLIQFSPAVFATPQAISLDNESVVEYLFAVFDRCFTSPIGAAAISQEGDPS